MQVDGGERVVMFNKFTGIEESRRGLTLSVRC